MKILFQILLLSIPLLISAQIEEDFSDGNFSNDPSWGGSSADFAVNNEMLQLNASAAGISYLATSVSINGATSWEFFIELDLNPSATGNFPKIFLSADNPDLIDNLNGYYLRIGETGANDAFELYRQDIDGTQQFIFRFLTEGEMSAGSNNTARVKVTRDNAGMWNFFANYEGGNCFSPEGSVLENTHTTGNYFGFSCKYTSGSLTKFIFDDIYVNATAPFQSLELTEVKSNASNSIDLSFSNNPDPSSATTAANYVIKDENGTILASADNATIDGVNPNEVHLELTGAFMIETGQAYTLCVNNVVDCNNNPIGSNNSQVFYLIEAAAPYDILINELLVDPTPQLGLPEFEFLELYNRSNKAISLKDFQFIKDNTTGILPEYILFPNSYLIICKEDALPLFEPYGPSMVIPSFSFSLPNEDAELSLMDPDGNLIDYVHYFKSWYKNSSKSEGGYSLELINPNKACEDESNWQASTDIQGGTPGEANGSLINSPDLVDLKLLSIFVEDPNAIILDFSKAMDIENSSILDNYSIDQGIQIIDAVLIAPENKKLRLSLANSLQEDIIYTIQVLNTTTDCLGKAIGEMNTLSFGLPEEAEAFDIFINEIMAAPNPTVGLPNVEYLELYNASDKLIELSGFGLTVGSSQRTLPNYQLLPKEYLIVCASVFLDSLIDFGAVLPMESFPGLSNDGTSIHLTTPFGETMHYVKYTTSSYQDKAKDDGGWSLEMINPNQACEGESNWRASQNPFGGTPGRVNSVLEDVLDDKRPDLIRVFPEDINTLLLSFSEVMDLESAEEIENYMIDQGINISSAQLLTPAKNQVRLFLGTSLEANTIYTIMIRDQVTDCLGNAIGIFDERAFALPVDAEPGDVLLNEVLFDPLTNGAEFIELYNNSSKVINVGDLVFAKSIDDPSPKPIRFNYLLFPKEYIAISPDIKDIKEKYTVKNPFVLFQNSIPSLTNEEGNILVYRGDFPDIITIDEFTYSEDYHNALLSDAKGVSLERIDPNAATQDPNNWHSAAKDVGYATPTYLNSQNLFINPGEDIISLSSTSFSPDGDAFKDFIQIFYNTPEVGYTAKVNIYDARGRVIKKLVDQDLLARSGTLKWDGSTDNGDKARIGIYILWVQLLNPNGDVQEIKKTIVVAGQL